MRTFERAAGRHPGRATCPASGRGDPAATACGRSSRIDHPATQAAARCLREVFGAGARTTCARAARSGAAASFDAVLGLPVVLLGFTNPDDQAHAPNENMVLANYEGGIRTIARYWAALRDAARWLAATRRYRMGARQRRMDGSDVDAGASTVGTRRARRRLSHAGACEAVSLDAVITVPPHRDRPSRRPPASRWQRPRLAGPPRPRRPRARRRSRPMPAGADLDPPPGWRPLPPGRSPPG